MMARVLAQEVWGDGISVNEVIPGPVLTERAQASYASEKDSVFSIDSEWVKTPKDVVPIILFLAGHPDPGPNGQTFSLLKRDM
jgi:3-oxoacyl-[acyl-carrier protein] reductase